VSRKGKKGFTLVELIIVIAILSILTITAIPVYTGIQGRAQRNMRIAEANTVVHALDSYNALASKKIGTEWSTQFSGNILLLRVDNTLNFNVDMKTPEAVAAVKLNVTYDSVNGFAVVPEDRVAY